jgi:DNA-directed RNA polymerase specialized sigma24 family protein
MVKTNDTLLGRLGLRRRLQREICAERERLYRIAWSWTHDAHEADDLVQDTLARALGADLALQPAPPAEPAQQGVVHVFHVPKDA